MNSLSAEYLSIVIPVFNEEATLRELVTKVLQVPGLQEVVVVDDCSTDGSAAIIEDLCRSSARVRSVRLDKNSGKTAALRKGFSLTRGEVVIVQDADLEYDPEEIAHVVAPIVRDKADVVYGSRFLAPRAARVLYFYHYVANKLLTFFSNACTNLNMTDVETCYKAFRGEIIRNMIITSRGFGAEIEMTAKIAKLKCRVYEVPISYYGRTYEEGKKITALDGIKAFWYIVRYNLLCSKAASFISIPVLARISSEETVQAGGEKVRARAAGER
ncbi:MAG: glycosyltransferase family 2 protein [Terriglobales bacterium]